MNYKGMAQLSIIFIMSLAVFWGCPKKAEIATSPESSQEAAMAEQAAAEQEAEAQRAAEEAAAARAAEEERLAEAARAREAAAAGLQPVYFDYDQSFIRGDATSVIRSNAAWLKAHPGTRIRIEGNADERGTVEYNQALAQRRAESAKKYLIDLGIPANRITLLSYGKERPVCREHSEDCWKRNRRDDFVAAEE